MREILRELDDQLTDEELDIMIEEIDSDGSGTVDFDGMYFSIVLYYNCKFSFITQNQNIKESIELSNLHLTFYPPKLRNNSFMTFQVHYQELGIVNTYQHK